MHSAHNNGVQGVLLGVYQPVLERHIQFAARDRSRVAAHITPEFDLVLVVHNPHVQSFEVFDGSQLFIRRELTKRGTLGKAEAFQAGIGEVTVQLCLEIALVQHLVDLLGSGGGEGTGQIKNTQLGDKSDTGRRLHGSDLNSIIQNRFNGLNIGAHLAIREDIYSDLAIRSSLYLLFEQDTPCPYHGAFSPHMCIGNLNAVLGIRGTRRRSRSITGIAAAGGQGQSQSKAECQSEKLFHNYFSS